VMIPLSLELPSFHELTVDTAMTKIRLTLAELLEKGTHADLIREMLSFMAKQLMDSDVEGLCGAAAGEQSEERTNRRKLNVEVKRNSDVVGIFPNERATVRLVGALLLEQTDARSIQQRYVTLETLASVDENALVRLPAIAN